MGHPPKTRREYLSACWEHAQHHWIAAVLAAVGVVYSALTNYGVVLQLPDWAKPEKWPKLPVSWAFVIVLAAIAFIAIEGGTRLHLQTMKEMESIGGPELFIGYENLAHRNCPWLVIVNNPGGGTAYSVMLKVPEDGSKLTSKEINILKDDGTTTILPVGSQNKLDAADVIMARVEGLPFVLTCMDADCRRFIYKFEQPPKASSNSGFLLIDKKCIGRATQP